MAPVGAQTKPTTVHLIGDSTMADMPDIPANPERGWGQMLPMYFKDPLRVENYAQNGRSTKCLIGEGRWNKVVAALKPGDYFIIRFGHNDENGTVRTVKATVPSERPFPSATHGSKSRKHLDRLMIY